MKVLCIRTKMVGGGTSYDVYVPIENKSYRPISFGTYATVIWRDKGKYYRVDDFLRTPELDTLPALTDERLDAFKRLRKVARRLEVRIAKRVFKELGSVKKLPTLWGNWTLPSKDVWVEVNIKNRDLAHESV